MYRIVLTCFDSNIKAESYKEEIEQEFNSREDAEIFMLRSMNDELSTLNQPDENNVPHTRVFIADLDGEHDAIVRMWDGNDYWDVTYYDIEGDELKEFSIDTPNGKLIAKAVEDVSFPGISIELITDEADGVYPKVLVESTKEEGTRCFIWSNEHDEDYSYVIPMRMGDKS